MPALKIAERLSTRLLIFQCVFSVGGVWCHASGMQCNCIPKRDGCLHTSHGLCLVRLLLFCLLPFRLLLFRLLNIFTSVFQLYVTPNSNWKYDNGKPCIPVHTSSVGLALPTTSVQGILEPSLQQRPSSSLCSYKLAFHLHLSLITDWWSTLQFLYSTDVRPSKNFDFGIRTSFDVSGCSSKEYPQNFKSQ